VNLVNSIGYLWHLTSLESIFRDELAILSLYYCMICRYQWIFAPSNLDSALTCPQSINYSCRCLASLLPSSRFHQSYFPVLTWYYTQDE
jgi:hypothetical protein